MLEKYLKYPSGKNLGKDKQIEFLKQYLDIIIYYSDLDEKDAEYFIKGFWIDHFGLYAEEYHVGCRNYPDCDITGDCGEWS